MARAQTVDGDRTGSRRAYRSPLREQRTQQTRAAILEAATRLFVSEGWAGTSVRDIAKAAGVATETLYTHFSSKAELLQRASDIAVVGDDADLPVAARPEFAALGQGSRAIRIAAAARLIAAVNVRTAGFAKVIREAATTDEAMAASLAATRERQRTDVARGLELVLGRQPTTAERDGTWALASPELYLLLVESSGWSPEQYEAWVGETLAATIPRR